ncbi:MAG: FAD-binding oxidoreductase [Ardenticatenia bacterium]|nr:FAD-binding oxidoreductase [Ardenticatenia bacterium]
MTTVPPTADVVIIGGGVMGTSTAYHLARKGCRRVVVLERADFFGQGATGACAGGIRHQFTTEVNIRLSIESIRMLERFPEEMEQDIGLNQCGYLFLLTTDEEVAAFREHMTLQHRLGVATEWLSVEEIARRVPQLNVEGIQGGTFYGRDGLCDPHSVVMGYVKQARRLGATLFTDTPVTGIEVVKGRVAGVQTPRGRIATEHVVIAAGPWAGVVGEMAGVPLPVRPLRRQIAVTRPVPWMTRDFPFVIDFHHRLYFHWESGGVLTGMSNPNETFGFKTEVDHEWTLIHLEWAVRRLPPLADAELQAQWAGLYEVTPDHNPIIGRLSSVEGLYAVTGFSGHGFMHGPVAGLLVAEEILDGQAHTVDITPLRYDRFVEGVLAREHHVV